MMSTPQRPLDSVPGVVVYLNNAFYPDRGRLVEQVPAPMTIRAWLDEQRIIEFDRPTLCLLNGQPVLRDVWAVSMIREGDVCSFVTLPHGGGGGGGGGSNPLRIVLTIAIMVLAVYTGGLAAGALGFAQGTAGYAAVSAGVGLAVSAIGSVLVNALVPLPKPSSSAFLGGGYAAPPAASPTYSIEGQGNRARLGQSIPCQYGRHRVYPDLIVAEPWSDYIGNEQYLYQPHCLGLGEFDIERIQIADSDIDSFDEITYEVVPPGEDVTLFDINVVTRPEVSGQELKGSNEWDGDGFVGPFILNPVDTVANKVGVDIIFGRGLYYANDSGGLDSKTVNWVVQVRPIDDDDIATGDGSWTTIATESYSAATNETIRLSYEYTLATGGRYEVQARRTDAKDTSSRAGHEIRWAALKAFVDGPTSFADVTLLLVKMRATDNLSQRSSRLVNTIQTRKIPVWDTETETWSDPAASRSIVWAFADICRASYGAKLTNAQLPISELVALDTLLESRGDKCDGVFDTKTTIWDALTRVARCGRAVPVLQGGIVRIIRDTPQTLPVAMFSPRNIVKGSLEINYIMPSDDTADAVTVEFFNQRTWKPGEVTGSIEGSSEEAPATVGLWGVVAADHALREADYMAADNAYRRKFVKFKTERDGNIPTYGDLITVSHPMPRWGAAGEIIEWDALSAILTLSEPVAFADGETHYIGLRKLDGGAVGPFECEAVEGSTNKVHLLDSLSITPYTGSAKERTYFSFGVGDKWTQMCRLRGIRPRKRGTEVEIFAVAEDSRVHVN